MVKEITRDELLLRIRDNAELALLEALPGKYFNDWHLPGAKHFPHDQVKQLAPAIVPDKQAEVVVYCANAACQNSHIAAKQLSALGYTRVAVYSGGKKDWSEAGLEVEKSESLV